MREAKIKHPQSKKTFPHFFCEIGCHLALQFQISERAFYQIKIFQKHPIIWYFPVGTSEGINFLKKFFGEAPKWVCISAPFVQMSEGVFLIRKYFPV